VDLILNIDTAIDSASVCLADGDEIIGLLKNPSAKDSASWIQPAIQQLLSQHGLSLKELAAVAVSNGPGSYTGLRVGLSTAKGICYALNKPLITINTLKMMAVSAQSLSTDYLCPMIDARRMEVFTAVYTQTLDEIRSQANLVLREDSLADLLRNNTMAFFGNGSKKFKATLTNQNAYFYDIEIDAKYMCLLTKELYLQRRFADLAYSEPNYGKDFYTPIEPLA
jgi:tRNA threonylcarbamoyladenosine biosynthesis protein TsaB